MCKERWDKDWIGKNFEKTILTQFVREKVPDNLLLVLRIIAVVSEIERSMYEHHPIFSSKLIPFLFYQKINFTLKWKLRRFRFKPGLSRTNNFIISFVLFVQIFRFLMQNLFKQSRLFIYLTISTCILILCLKYKVGSTVADIK